MTHPTPQLVFTVAIARHQDIPAGRQAGVRLLVARDKGAVDRQHMLNLCFVSALAPGAAQIGAHAALDPTHTSDGWKLCAILPFAAHSSKALASVQAETDRQ